MAKKMPWEAPDFASPTFREIQEEKEKDRAHGATIEGGCWFSHVGGIDKMEKSYGRRSRDTEPEDSDESIPEPE